MKRAKAYYVSLLSIFMQGCVIIQDCGESRQYSIATYNNNTCKILTKTVTLYAIFIDARQTGFYTGFDIQSTLDSIKKATAWIEQKANEAGIPLTVNIRHLITNKGTPLVAELPKKTIAGTAGFTFTGTSGYLPAGEKLFNRWSDKICREAFASLPADTSTVVKSKYQAKGKKEFIARLRDIYAEDDIALMFFVVNYYRDDFSVAVNTGLDEEPEYAVVSHKDPAVIAHEFLHLFGAIDLYFNNKTKRVYRKKLELLQLLYPNEVMLNLHRPLSKLEISPLTEYLIGWKPSLDAALQKKIFGDNFLLAEH